MNKAVGRRSFLNPQLELMGLQPKKKKRNLINYLDKKGFFMADIFVCSRTEK